MGGDRSKVDNHRFNTHSELLNQLRTSKSTSKTRN